MGRPEVPTTPGAAQAKRDPRSAKKLSEQAGQRYQALQHVAARAALELADLDVWSAAVESSRRQLAALDRLDAEEAEREASEAASTAPPLPTLLEAQQQLDAAVDAVIARHREWVAQRSDAAPGPDGKRPARQPIPAPPPTKIMVGTGVGKTSRAIPRLAAAVPTVSSLRTLDLCRDLVGKLAAAGVSARLHLGAHAPGEGETVSSPYVCTHYESTACPLGENGHLLKSVACGSCIEGGLAVVKVNIRRNRMDAAAEASDRVQHLADTRGVDASTTGPCGRILALDEEPELRTLVQCSGAFTPGSLDYDPGYPWPLEDRLLVIDESSQLYHLIDVGTNQLNDARKNIWATVLKLEARAANPKPDDDPDELTAMAIFGRELVEILGDVGAALVTATPGDWHPSPALAAQMGNLAEYAALLLDKNSAAPTAFFEQPVLHWGAEHEIPLRMLADLGWAFEHDLLQIIDGRLVGVVPTAQLKSIVNRTAHAVVLDATPDPILDPILIGLGGELAEAVPEQPVDITYHPARVHGRYALATDPARLAAEVAGIQATVERKTKERGRAPVVGAHRVVAQALIEAGMPAGDVGWHGRHERGTDEFAGRDLFLTSIRIPSEREWRTMWIARRGLLKWATEIELPEWVPERASGYVVEIVPGCPEVSPLALCTDPTIRAWQLEFLGAEAVQWLGRKRAVHNPGCQADITAPPVPLGFGGYRRVTVDRFDPVGMPPTASVVNEARRLGTDARLAAALLEERRTGKRFTRNGMRAWLREHAGAGFRSSKLTEWRQKYAGLSDADLAAVAGAIIEQAEAIVEHGGRVVGLQLLAAHLVEHDEDCHCTLRAAAELLAACGDAVLGAVEVRGPPVAA